jgi:anti-sigma factor RsiW
MNRCLKDQMLLLLHDGEGTGAERAHLTECEACARRYRQLESDLKTVTQALRQAPLPQTARS